MAEKAWNKCFTWIADEKKIHETADYGANQKAVQDALQEQEHRVDVVKDYEADLSKLSGKHKSDDHEAQGAASYSDLSTVSQKRLGCLKDITQIAGLEDFLNNVSVELADRATNLVNSESEKAADTPPNGSLSMARAAQGCIFAVNDNWAWISKLVKCTDTHLANAAEYHKFFHEINECGVIMCTELKAAQTKCQLKEGYTGEANEAEKIHWDLKELLTLLLHWQQKTAELFERSKKIIPVQLRTQKLQYFRPVVSLCDYSTKEIRIRACEELTLVDNSDPKSWQVRNIHHREVEVPSVICLIPGPHPEAVQAALNLRLQLLAIWTQNLKRIGKTIIYFLLLVLPEWTEEEKKKLKAVPAEKNAAITKSMQYVNDVMAPYWSDYIGFKKMKERTDETCNNLTADGDKNDADRDFQEALVTKTSTCEDLLKGYAELWKQWETLKILVETCKHAELLLIVDKWEQYKFMDLAELLKRWHTGLEFGDGDDSDFWEFYEKYLKRTTIVEETVTTTESEQHEFETTTETAETEHLTASEQEEKKTFVITGVLDPRSGEEVSMQQAIMLGIINNKTGTYVNPDTGIAIPIPAAMNQGNIKVEFTTTKKSAEKRKDVGLITIKTQKESRPYTLKGVLDAKSDQQLSIDEAIQKGILDQKRNIYKNSLDDSEMSLGEALDSGFLLVEFDASAEVTEPEVITRTYVIHTILDQQRKKRVPFSEAIQLGLIDRENGSYYNNIKDEQVYVGDAIRAGHIKASIVKDPSKINIDPSNKIVADKVRTIKEKLLKPGKALAALTKAAAGMKNGK